MLSSTKILLLAFIPALLSGQSLSIVSGNGQMVLEQFLSTVPLTIQARDGAGNPAAGIAITWSITQGVGTLVGRIETTDAKGQASTSFLATYVTPGLSFQAATVTASSAVGSVNFVVTTVLWRLPGGAGIAAPPLVELLVPALDSPPLSGNAGAILPGAVVVRVTAQSGVQTGLPVPNIGVRISNEQDPALSPSASCNGPGGLVLTDVTGVARCDLVLNQNAGTANLRAVAGEIQATRNFLVQINAGAACSYAITPSTQSFGPAGGAGTASVTAPAGCAWSASSSAAWISVTSSATGSGSGTVSYFVAANDGPARSGALAVAGLTLTVSQSAAGTPSPLVIVTGATLPGGVIGVFYSATLIASGGRPPYTWSVSGALPPGLGLNPSGVISGTPSSAGNYGFSLIVTDAAGAVQSQSFTINISTSAGGLVITNASFPNGVVSEAYQQALTSSGGCTTPFTPRPVFSVMSGSLPPGLSLQPILAGQAIAGTPTTPGTFGFTLGVTDACGRTVSASFTITITATGPVTPPLAATPASLPFTVPVGSSARPADQSISVTAASPLSFTAVASGGNWLAITSSASGTTPAVITVGVVNFSGLAPGTYSGSIIITASGSSVPRIVQVTLTVTPAATLSVNPLSLTFTQPTQVISRQVIAITASGGPVRFTASASTATGGWLSVSAAVGDAPAIIQIIANSTGLGPGVYTGAITVSASGAGNSPQTVAVTLNVLGPPTLTVAPTSLSFAYQQGVAPPAPQTLTLETNVASLNFTTSVTTPGGNWLFVSPTAGAAPTSVTVSVNPLGLAPGTYNGTISIAFGAPASLTVSVSLRIAQPVPVIASVTNAASFAPGPVAPGEFITIFGSGLGPANLTTLRLNAAGLVDTVLSDTRVLFDEIAAPLVYVSEGQVSAIVPYAVAGRFSTRVQVDYKGVRATASELRVAASVPGIFPGAILNEDGSPNTAQNGADTGSIVVFFATGEGQTDPPGVDGKLATDELPKPRQAVAVRIGGLDAEILYAGAAPGLPAGVLQVNARVPAAARRGQALPLTLMVGDNSSPAGVTVFVRGQ